MDTFQLIRAAAAALGMLASLSVTAGNLSHSLVDLGESLQFQNRDAEISITNQSEQRLHLRTVEPIRSGDRAKSWPKYLQPGASGLVRVSIATGADAGVSLHKFRLRLVSGNHDEILVVRNFGITMLADARPMFDMGVVKQSAGNPPKPLVFRDDRGQPIRIERMLGVPNFLSVAIDETGFAATMSLSPGANLGRHVGLVRAALASTLQPVAEIEVTADIKGDVVPSANPLTFGLVTQGETNERRLVLRSEGNPFSVGGVALEGILGSSQVESCSPKSNDCAAVVIRISEKQKTGRFSAMALVAIKEGRGREQTLQVGLTGLLTSKSTAIREIDASAFVNAMPPPLNIDQALRDLAQQERERSAAVPAGSEGPLLAWQVQQGADIHGYMITRASSKGGPFHAVAMQIPFDPSGTYRWRDGTAELGKTYWYQISAIRLDGRAVRLGDPHELRTRTDERAAANRESG